MRYRAPLLFVSALALGSVIASAGAAVLTPQQAVDARKNRYRELGAAFKSINDQARSGALVKVILRSSARTIAGVARDQYQWFPAGSGTQAGVKTKAKASIWKDPAGFRTAQMNFQRQADLMVQAVEGGKQADIARQAKALGQTCGACHKAYREED